VPSDREQCRACGAAADRGVADDRGSYVLTVDDKNKVAGGRCVCPAWAETGVTISASHQRRRVIATAGAFLQEGELCETGCPRFERLMKKHFRLGDPPPDSTDRLLRGDFLFSASGLHPSADQSATRHRVSAGARGHHAARRGSHGNGDPDCPKSGGGSISSIGNVAHITTFIVEGLVHTNVHSKIGTPIDRAVSGRAGTPLQSAQRPAANIMEPLGSARMWTGGAFAYTR